MNSEWCIFVFKMRYMSPSSKLWWCVYGLVVIGLSVLIHPMIFLIMLWLTYLFLPTRMRLGIEAFVAEFLRKVIVNPIKSFNRWVDSKFGK